MGQMRQEARVERLRDSDGTLTERGIVLLRGEVLHVLCEFRTLDAARQHAAFFESLARSGSGNESGSWPSLLLPDGDTVAMPGEDWEALAVAIEEVCAWTTPPGEERSAHA